MGVTLDLDEARGALAALPKVDLRQYSERTTSLVQVERDAHDPSCVSATQWCPGWDLNPHDLAAKGF